MSAPAETSDSMMLAAFNHLQREQEVPPRPNRAGNRNWWARSRAWMSILILAPFAAYTLFSEPMFARSSWADVTCDALGWTLFLAGAAIRWWATLHIGGNKSSMLVMSGPYSLCRNPLYVGTILLCLSVAAFLKSLPLFGGTVLAAIYYLWITVLAEERYLLVRLGEPFAEYCHRVPRFLPRWRTFEAPALIEVRYSGLAAEAWRTARWVWIPVICELLNQARFESWWPKLIDLS